MRISTFFRKAALVAVLAVSGSLWAQNPYNYQIISANGGLFETAAPYADYATIQSIDPLNNNVVVFDTVNTQSVQDVVVANNSIYFATQDSLVKYDFGTLSRTAITAVSGVNKIAVYNNFLIISRQYPATSGFVQIRSADDLSLLKEFPEVTGEAAGILVIGTKAHVAVNGGWAGTTGKIAFIDLVTVRFEKEIDLGPEAIGIFNLFNFKGSVLSVNRTPYGSTTGSLTLLDPDGHFLTTIYNANIGTGYQVFSNILYVNINGNIGSFDLGQMTVIDPVLIMNPAAASFGSIASACLDTLNKKFYVNTTDYFSFGQGYVYSFTGDSIGSFTSGISPEAIAIDYRLTTGITPPNTESTLQLSPNPCNNTLNIYNIPQNSTIEILTLSGKVFANKNTDSGQNLNFTLDTSGLPAGVYILSVTNGQTISKRKFIKL